MVFYIVKVVIKYILVLQGFQKCVFVNIDYFYVEECSRKLYFLILDLFDKGEKKLVDMIIIFEYIYDNYISYS